MLHVNLYIAVLAYAGAIISVLVGIWMWMEFSAHGGHLGGLGTAQRKWKCLYCGYVYLGTGGEDVSQCPRCQSYNKI